MNAQLAPSEADRSPAVDASDRFSVPDVAGVTGEPAALPIMLPSFRPTDYLLLSFRGLPKDFSLSSGFRTTDAWLVSAHESEGLQIVPPADYSGAFTLEVRLIRGQDTLARTNIVQIKFETPAPSSAGKIQQADDLQDDQIAEIRTEKIAPAPKLEPLSPSTEKHLLEIAEAMLDQNDIAAARSVYLYLAQHSSLDGRVRLAKSYDPDFLARFDIAGALTDLKKARKWYKVAAESGSEYAFRRLAELEEEAKE